MIAPGFSARLEIFMNTRSITILLCLCSAILAAGVARADKPNAQQKKSHKSPSATQAVTVSYFTDDRVRLITDYYSNHKSAKGCPPGLAKKGNGCQPPGQAKKWRRGEPLPHDVVYYDVPTAVIHEIGLPPAGQKIVRVGTDLLLIGIGTGMVIDALEDLGDIF
jgi:Ni/Co efflux regulator RcnB